MMRPVMCPHLGHLVESALIVPPKAGGEVYAVIKP